MRSIILFLLTIANLLSSEFLNEEKTPKATFSDSTGVYNVDLILEWALKNKGMSFSFQTQSLADFLLLDTWGESEETPTSNLKHLLEDPKHFQRVLLADLESPLVLTNFNTIVDGVHRLAKAIYEGHSTIRAIYIDRSILDLFKMHNKTSSISPPSLTPNASIPDIRVLVPKNSLTQDPLKRKFFLEDYFTDQLPSAFEKENQWEILLERPATPYGCYQFDPHIRGALAWWNPGTLIRNIPSEYRLLNPGLLAIEDQWMPLSWSLCFERLKTVPQELILLHLDDHKDMMSPRIGKRLDGKFVDYITGNHISFIEPSTVKEAILSGAIGKGSILTPLIHAIEKIHVRHLSFRPENGEAYKIIPSLDKDPLLSSIPNRLAIHLEQKPWEILNETSNYVMTSEEERWLSKLPDNVPVLLHIDMDFFNDRFDGNQDWETEHKRIYNPTLEEQKTMADRIFQALQSHNLEKRIIDVCIGISPSFYPGEYWHEMVPYVLKKCNDLCLLKNNEKY